MIPYNRKLERNKFEIILGFFQMILLDYIRPVAIFELSVFVWILFEFIKVFTL